jgi:hypothetical protein
MLEHDEVARIERYLTKFMNRVLERAGEDTSNRPPITFAALRRHAAKDV